MTLRHPGGLQHGQNAIHGATPILHVGQVQPTWQGE